MEYNKHQYTKSNEKKFLHKVGKNWIAVSTITLALLGGTTLIHVSANTSNNKPNQQVAAPKMVNTKSQNGNSKSQGNVGNNGKLTYIHQPELNSPHNPPQSGHYVRKFNFYLHFYASTNVDSSKLLTNGKSITFQGLPKTIGNYDGNENTIKVPKSVTNNSPSFNCLNNIVDMGYEYPGSYQDHDEFKCTKESSNLSLTNPGVGSVFLDMVLDHSPKPSPQPVQNKPSYITFNIQYSDNNNTYTLPYNGTTKGVPYTDNDKYVNKLSNPNDIVNKINSFIANTNYTDGEGNTKKVGDFWNLISPNDILSRMNNEFPSGHSQQHPYVYNITLTPREYSHPLTYYLQNVTPGLDNNLKSEDVTLPEMSYGSFSSYSLPNGLVSITPNSVSNSLSQNTLNKIESKYHINANRLGLQVKTFIISNGYVGYDLGYSPSNNKYADMATWDRNNSGGTKIGWNNNRPVVKYYQVLVVKKPGMGVPTTLNSEMITRYPNLSSYLRLWAPEFNRNNRGLAFNNYILPYDSNPADNQDPYPFSTSTSDEQNYNGHYAHNIYSESLDNDNIYGYDYGIRDGKGWNDAIVPWSLNNITERAHFNYNNPNEFIQIVDNGHGQGVPKILDTNNQNHLIEAKDSTHRKPLYLNYEGQADSNYIITDQDGINARPYQEGTSGQMCYSENGTKEFIPTGATVLMDQYGNYMAYYNGKYYAPYSENGKIRNEVVPKDPLTFIYSNDDIHYQRNTDNYILNPIEGYAKNHPVTIEFINTNNHMRVGSSINLMMHAGDTLDFDGHSFRIQNCQSYDDSYPGDPTVSNRESQPFDPVPQGWQVDGQIFGSNNESPSPTRLPESIPFNNDGSFDGNNGLLGYDDGSQDIVKIGISMPQENAKNPVYVFYYNIDTGNPLSPNPTQIRVHVDPNTHQYDVYQYLPASQQPDGTMKLNDSDSRYKYIIVNSQNQHVPFMKDQENSVLIYLYKIDPNSSSAQNDTYPLVIKYYASDGTHLHYLNHDISIPKNHGGKERDTVDKILSKNGKSLWDYESAGYQEDGIKFDNESSPYVSRSNLGDDLNNPIFKDDNLTNRHPIFVFHHTIDIIISKKPQPERQPQPQPNPKPKRKKPKHGPITPPIPPLPPTPPSNPSSEPSSSASSVSSSSRVITTKANHAELKSKPKHKRKSVKHVKRVNKVRRSYAKTKRTKSRVKSISIVHHNYQLSYAPSASHPSKEFIIRLGNRVYSNQSQVRNSNHIYSRANHSGRTKLPQTSEATHSLIAVLSTLMSILFGLVGHLIKRRKNY